ncbi:MAG: glycosyltransferase family 2 protein [Oribacterium sp.]|nr:glycosyltransferase family 2 protein [Oribacterium sp.]
MKTISIVVPCYNEEENVVPLYNAIKTMFLEKLPEYKYEIIYIDNDSKDRTRELVRGLCAEDKDVKAIFNAKNFGQFNSPYYGMLQSTGDATMLMAADFQDPVEMIPEFVKAWEEGYKIAIGVKTRSQENPLMYWVRGIYYKVIKKMSSVDQIAQFTGFGLYDKAFINVMRNLNDPTPFLRGIVAELGFRRKEIPYTQPRRRAGITHNNWYSLYDAAMLSFTSYTKVGLRVAVFFGGICSAISMAIAVIYLIMKLIWWDRFPAGMAPMLIGMLFLGSIQIFFIGLLGEYILSINQRVMKRPLVVEEERLNFGDEPKYRGVKDMEKVRRKE